MDVISWTLQNAPVAEGRQNQKLKKSVNEVKELAALQK